jgi:TonB family protein
LVYPGRALERGIQGDVVVEVTTDERGQVSDARVLSGPDELRRSCLQSILQWRYAPPAPMPATTQVVIRFQIPREGAAKELVLPPDPDWKKLRVTAEGQVELQVSGAGAADLEKIERQMVELKAAAADPSLGPEDREKIKRQWAELSVLREKIRGNEGVEVVANKIAVEKHGLPQDIERQIEELKAGIEDPNASPERKEEWKRQLAAVKSQLESARAAGPAKEPVFIREQAIPIAGTLAAISSERVNQPTMDALGPRLGIRVGDRITPAIAKQVAEKVRAFDASLRAVFHVDEAGNVILVIVGP